MQPFRSPQTNAAMPNAPFATPRAVSSMQWQASPQTANSSAFSTQSIIPRLNSTQTGGQLAQAALSLQPSANLQATYETSTTVTPMTPQAGATTTKGNRSSSKKKNATPAQRGRTWDTDEVLTMLTLWNDKAPPQGSGTGLVHLTGDRAGALKRISAALRDRNPIWTREPDHVWDKWERLMKDHRKKMKKIASGATIEDPIVDALMEIQRIELDMAPIVENENSPGSEAISTHTVRRQIVEKVEKEKKELDEKNKKRVRDEKEKSEERRKRARVMDSIVKTNSMLLMLLSKHLNIPVESEDGVSSSGVSDDE